MSIRRYLVLTLCSIIILTTFIAAIQGYKNSMNQADRFFDNDLKSLANTIINSSLNQVSFTEKSASFAYQLWQNNALVAQSSNTPNTPISRFQTGFSYQNFSQQRWRIYSEMLPITLQDKTTERWIFVAQPTSARFAIAESLILSAVQPILISIPIIALLIWLIVRKALKPLNSLTDQLTEKRANDLTPVTLEKIPAELITVEQTMNQLFLRVSSSFEREKRFASDAAHELRTPLSVLKVNVHNLKNEWGDQNETLNHLSESVDRMAHVVDQILVLNRTNPEQFSQQLVAIDIHQLCQETISQLYPEIASRQQDISLEGETTQVTGNDFALRILLQNLISNASKYTPNQGKINLKIQSNNSMVLVTIEDSGPGIPEKEQDKIFNRFYRVGGDQHNSTIIGCGLGLAIVKHIAILHNATISLSTSANYGGLSITVGFPIQQLAKA